MNGDSEFQLLFSVLRFLTLYEGKYGPFLILVCLGFACTVWYGFSPAIPNHPPTDGAFNPIDSYNHFFDMNYYAPGFRKVSFIERNDVSDSVVSAFSNEQPFADITIPAIGNMLKAIGLGVMVAFFLAVGIVPNGIQILE